MLALAFSIPHFYSCPKFNYFRLELACYGKRQNEELRFGDNVWIDGVSLRAVEWFIYYGPRIDLNILSIDERLKQHGKTILNAVQHFTYGSLFTWSQSCLAISLRNSTKLERGLVKMQATQHDVGG